MNHWCSYVDPFRPSFANHEMFRFRGAYSAVQVVRAAVLPRKKTNSKMGSREEFGVKLEIISASFTNKGIFSSLEDIVEMHG